MKIENAPSTKFLGRHSLSQATKCVPFEPRSGPFQRKSLGILSIFLIIQDGNLKMDIQYAGIEEMTEFRSGPLGRDNWLSKKIIWL